VAVTEAECGPCSEPILLGRTRNLQCLIEGLGGFCVLFSEEQTLAEQQECFAAISGNSEVCDTASEDVFTPWFLSAHSDHTDQEPGAICDRAGNIPKRAEPPLGIVMVAQIDFNSGEAEHGLGHRSTDLEAAGPLEQVDQNGVSLVAIIAVKVHTSESDAGHLDHSEFVMTVYI
jgi:hypothetical protein